MDKPVLVTISYKGSDDEEKEDLKMFGKVWNHSDMDS